jgi:hypothetical protein
LKKIIRNFLKILSQIFVFSNKSGCLKESSVSIKVGGNIVPVGKLERFFCVEKLLHPNKTHQPKK